MIRLVFATVAAAAALAACQPTTGPSLAEKRIAGKIIDEGILGPVDREGLQQIAFQQVQGMMYQDGLSPQMAQQVLIGMTRNLEASMPEVREQMIAALSEELSVKEMELLLKFAASKEGKAIQEKLPIVGEKTSEQLRAHAQIAGAKALDELRAAWPAPLPKPPAADPAIPGMPPGAPGAPGEPAPALPN